MCVVHTQRRRRSPQEGKGGGEGGWLTGLRSYKWIGGHVVAVKEVY